MTSQQSPSAKTDSEVPGPAESGGRQGGKGGLDLRLPGAAEQRGHLIWGGHSSVHPQAD